MAITDGTTIIAANTRQTILTIFFVFVSIPIPPNLILLLVFSKNHLFLLQHFFCILSTEIIDFSGNKRYNSLNFQKSIGRKNKNRSDDRD